MTECQPQCTIYTMSTGMFRNFGMQKPVPARRILNAMKIRKMLTLNYEIDIHIVFFAFSEDFTV